MNLQCRKWRHPPLEGEGRFASRKARCETGWGDSLTPPRHSLVHPTPTFALLRSTLPLQGRVKRYFFAGAIFESLASLAGSVAGAAAGVAGVLAAWSMRSILAPSRSLAT
jgi:hypothetical protein